MVLGWVLSPQLADCLKSICPRPPALFEVDSVVNPTETTYRDHTIVVRDRVELPSTTEPVTSRIIEVDHVDVTSRCRMVTTEEQKTEEARRFIDRLYPKGKVGL